MSEKAFARQFVMFLMCGLIFSFLLVPSFSYGGVIFHVCVAGVVYYLISIFCKNSYIPYFIICGLGLLLYIANEYVYAARLSYIRIADFFCIGDALRVSGGYKVSFSSGVIIHIVLAVVFSIGGAVLVRLVWIFTEKKRNANTRIGKSNSVQAFGQSDPEIDEIIEKFDEIQNDAESEEIDSADNKQSAGEKMIRIPHARRLVPLIFFVLCLAGIVGMGIFGNQGGSKFDMDTEYKQNGLLLTWLYQFKRSTLDKPEGYSHENAEQTLAKYSSDGADGSADSDEQIPQLIVIMNESFTDYSRIGKVSWTQDPLDDIHTNTEIKSGLMLSSVYGGYTANPEFEFLTGMSLSFLPEAKVPYLSYLKNVVENYVDACKANGYYTYALHPYYGLEFNRLTVYNNCFGFDKSVFGENMGETLERPGNDVSDVENDRGDFGPGHDYYRGFISDRECYDTLLSELDSGKKEFVFNVTVHNHGGYGVDKYHEDGIEYTGDKEWDDFLNGVARSDDDFSYFISELKKRDGKYLVLFFGDHQPALPGIRYKVSIYGDYLMEGGEKPLYDYFVPYYIWTNTDIDTSDIPEYTSANYLSILFKKLAGIPYDNWDRLIEAAEQVYPVLAPQYVSRDGENFIRTKDVDIRSDQVMKDYEMVQYDRLFG